MAHTAAHFLKPPAAVRSHTLGRSTEPWKISPQSRKKVEIQILKWQNTGRCLIALSCSRERAHVR